MQFPKIFSFLFVFVLVLSLPGYAVANHSWGEYHWARTANPFTLKLGDNVSSVWDPYLAEASVDWTASSVLNTTVVSGLTSPRSCRPKSGRVEVCNYRYGNNGWLGVAQIWISGNHITQGIAKMNDTYFNSSTYNTPAWRRLVMCQEIAHEFGLNHQDEVFNNPNLGSCMDYTNNPDGPPSNEHPNAHDFSMLETIYGHLDAVSSVGQSLPNGNSQTRGKPAFVDAILDEPKDWGQKIRDNGHVAVFERDFGNSNKVVTHVIWASEDHHN